jgi:hypothetical protein
MQLRCSWRLGPSPDTQWFIPPFVRPIRRPHPPFSTTDWRLCPSHTCFACAVRQWMCFEVVSVERDGFIIRCFCGQSLHDPREYTQVTPVDRQHMRSMCERGRFQRFKSVLGGRYSLVESHHRRRGVACSHLETSFDVSSGHMARTGAHPIAIDEDNGAVTVVFRSGAHVKRPFVRRPRGFSSPMLNADDAGCRSR